MLVIPGRPTALLSEGGRAGPLLQLQLVRMDEKPQGCRTLRRRCTRSPEAEITDGFFEEGAPQNDEAFEDPRGGRGGGERRRCLGLWLRPGTGHGARLGRVRGPG